ncbi:hypothetical protein JOL62DRAFT_589015 [Phyllosticta paracitricarpa]|uniref:F-box domain-containing protein n=1 Tax=Phyllosticta paracitricarpa TaxID=2016321 RepID=A0ABR1MU36_9PEZI
MESSKMISLPSELLLQVFTNFTTTELLPLATTSHRVHDLIIRIIRARLHFAAHLHDYGYALILESSDPSHIMQEPYMFCTPQETEESEANDAGKLEPCQTDSLGHLRSRYTRFRLHRQGPEHYRRTVRPGDIPGSRTHPSTAEPTFTGGGRPGEGAINQLWWTCSQQFFQLCVHLRFFNKHSRAAGTIQKKVIRVFWEWLSASPDAPLREGEHSQSTSLGNTEPSVDQEDLILWFSSDEDVGLKLRVSEQRLTEDEKMFDVNYNEVIVRTSHLLLTLEKSLLGSQGHGAPTSVLFGSLG